MVRAQDTSDLLSVGLLRPNDEHSHFIVSDSLFFRGSITDVFVLGDGQPALPSDKCEPFLIRGPFAEMVVVDFYGNSALAERSREDFSPEAGI